MRIDESDRRADDTKKLKQALIVDSIKERNNSWKTQNKNLDRMKKMKD
jgi:hypothetical protein